MSSTTIWLALPVTIPILAFGHCAHHLRMVLVSTVACLSQSVTNGCLPTLEHALSPQLHTPASSGQCNGMIRQPRPAARMANLSLRIRIVQSLPDAAKFRYDQINHFFGEKGGGFVRST